MSPEREIVSSRVFNFSREILWTAFAEPQHLAEWRGPKGFTNHFHEFDFRPGGNWRFVMHGPDGRDYPNQSVFTEVLIPEKIIFIHLDPVHQFQMTITFSKQAEKTKLVWQMLFQSAEECLKVKTFVREANENNFDRLEVQLAKMKTHLYMEVV